MPYLLYWCNRLRSFNITRSSFEGGLLLDVFQYWIFIFKLFFSSTIIYNSWGFYLIFVGFMLDDWDIIKGLFLEFRCSEPALVQCFQRALFIRDSCWSNVRASFWNFCRSFPPSIIHFHLACITIKSRLFLNNNGSFHLITFAWLVIKLFLLI